MNDECDSICLHLAYDGSAFFGWQDNHQQRSVEAVLRAVLSQILQHPLTLQAASRTDAGVHAKGQVVHFFTPKRSLHLEDLHHSLNALLPEEMSVSCIERKPLSFHPSLDACRKEYHYHLHCTPYPDPFQRHFSWHVPFELDLNAMVRAASELVGSRDFRAFRNHRPDLVEKNGECTLEKVEISKEKERALCIQMVGDRFLYRMARNIAGTLVYVGKGKIAPHAMQAILESQDRTQAGVTAPAHGLCLMRIDYPTISNRAPSSN